MKRRGVAAIAALTVALSVWAPSAAGAASQVATATWLRGGKKKPVGYVADAMRFVDPVEGAVTLGGVGKIPCNVSGGKRFRFIICMGWVELKEIPFEDFVVDPVLSTASMKVTLRGKDHQVEWTAADLAPTSEMGAQAGPHGVGGAAGMSREAEASGSVFGADLNHTAHDFAALAQGAGAVVEPPITRTRRVVFVVPIPRNGRG
ncbi:MAG TPA: hypothetical protein VM573_10355 [Actinomycetota bacterium]|jgi:hypothetical protein|nr:hypothetical protein [Actinomycetota bacterium]